jgi:hypothetical protein
MELDMAQRNNIDWEKIETLYRVGQLSVRDIAAEMKVEPSTITRRAKKDGWTRDLSEQVRRETKAALLRNATPNATSPTRARAGIDAAVYTNVGLIETHRSDIKYGRELVATLMAQLMDVAGSRDAMEDLIIENTDAGRKRSAMLRAVALPSHAATLRDLATALKILIPLERQAYNIDEKPPEDSYEELLDRALALDPTLGQPA